MSTSIRVAAIYLACDHPGCDVAVGLHQATPAPMSSKGWVEWWNYQRREGGWHLSVMGDNNYCLCPEHNPDRRKS